MLAETLLLGVVQACVIKKHNHSLDFHYYFRMGATEVVDLKTIQCVVGCVFNQGQWVIFNHSGDLAHALYIKDPEGPKELNNESSST